MLLANPGHEAVEIPALDLIAEPEVPFEVETVDHARSLLEQGYIAADDEALALLDDIEREVAEAAEAAADNDASAEAQAPVEDEPKPELPANARRLGEPREHAGTGVEMTGVEVPAAGALSAEISGDGSGDALPEVDPALYGVDSVPLDAGEDHITDGEDLV